MTAAKTWQTRAMKRTSSERDDTLGGKGRSIAYNLEKRRRTGLPENLISDVQKNDKITVHLNSNIDQVDGFVGNFETTMSENSAQMAIKHGVGD